MKGENFINEQSFSPTRDLEEEYIHVYVERRGEESVPRVDTYANRWETGRGEASSSEKVWTLGDEY